MGEGTDQIAREIDRTRAELGKNLRELEYRVKDATDWRKIFQRNPLPLMAAAFGVGLLFSALLGPRYGSR